MKVIRCQIRYYRCEIPQYKQTRQQVMDLSARERIFGKLCALTKSSYRVPRYYLICFIEILLENRKLSIRLNARTRQWDFGAMLICCLLRKINLASNEILTTFIRVGEIVCLAKILYWVDRPGAEENEQYQYEIVTRPQTSK